MRPGKTSLSHSIRAHSVSNSAQKCHFNVHPYRNLARFVFLPRICPLWVSTTNKLLLFHLSCFPNPPPPQQRSDPDDCVTWHSCGFPLGSGQEGADGWSKSRSGRQVSPFHPHLCSEVSFVLCLAVADSLHDSSRKVVPPIWVQKSQGPHQFSSLLALVHIWENGTSLLIPGAWAFLVVSLTLTTYLYVPCGNLLDL